MVLFTRQSFQMAKYNPKLKLGYFIMIYSPKFCADHATYDAILFKTLAVKNINMMTLYFNEEQFLDVICTGSRLRHPNIVSLIGYCLEYGQHLLVYQYIQNLSLDDALHSSAYKPLSWGVRLQIAVGIAQALK